CCAGRSKGARRDRNARARRAPARGDRCAAGESRRAPRSRPACGPAPATAGPSGDAGRYRPDAPDAPAASAATAAASSPLHLLEGEGILAGDQFAAPAPRVPTTNLISPTLLLDPVRA